MSLDRESLRERDGWTVTERKEMAERVLETYPLSEEERNAFVESSARVNKILGIETYRDRRIVATIVASRACLAGHQEGDRILFDSMGRLLTDDANKPVCLRLLNRAWYRLIMILDRMGDATRDSIRGGRFEGEVVEVRMSCYGAPFPYGDCGQVIMQFSVEESA